jgi:folate-dependent phosphoribosylglycinamide formyltransferase PurN
MMLEPLIRPRDEPVRTAILMSGSGTNAVKLIGNEMEHWKVRSHPPYEVVTIVTDNEGSNARQIGEQFQKPAICIDLQEFLGSKNHAAPKMELRAEYDSLINLELKERGVELVLLAGWDWIVTQVICEGYIAANVHPGDLRVKKKNGKPLLAGLGWIPSAKAILRGFPEVYSTTHRVTSGLDEGNSFMVSQPVPVDLGGYSREDLLPEGMKLGGLLKERRANGFDNLPETPLEKLAKAHQERLKVKGDWEIFPRTAEFLCLGLYQRDVETGQLYFDGDAIPNGLQHIDDMTMNRWSD